PKYRITVNGENRKVTAALKPGETSTSIVRVMNEGTAPIENIQVTPPQKLPWVTISVSGTELVLPIKGRTIRDENTSASILVTITPEIYVAPGTYNDEIVITSNAGEAKVPLLIYVGPEKVGTIVLQMVDQDYIPIPGAAVTIYGPHSTPGEQPAAPTVHRRTADYNGIVTFMNIQAGTYTLTAKASYHKDTQMTLEVPALIDLEPLPVQMEKIPFTLSYDYRTLSETMSAIVTGGNYEGAVLRATLPPASAIPSLVANFPGSEFWYSYQLSWAGNNFAVRNPSTEGSVYDVEARVTDAETLPEGSIRLRLKNQTGGTSVLNLGEFGPEAAEEIYWDVDLNKFYDPADIQPMTTEWDYRVVFPEGTTPGRIEAWEKILGYDHTVLRLDNSNEATGVYYYHIVPKKTVAQPYIPDNRIPKFYGDNYIFDFNIQFTGNRFTSAGEWESISYKVPVRLHYQPRDASSIPIPEDDRQETKVMAAFTKQSKTPPAQKKRTYPWYPPTKQQLRAWQMYEQDTGDSRYFSKNFLNVISSVPSEKPETVGPAIGDFSFSQEVVTEQEVFTAEFNLFNPSKYKLLENVDLEVIVTDGVIDENGSLSEGARVYNNWFNIRPLIAINGVKMDEPGDPGQEVPEGEYDDSTGNGIYNWTVLPETELSVLWQLNADPGLAETRMFNDELYRQLLNLAEHLQSEAVFTVYIHYRFEHDGQQHEGYTKGRRIRVEPQPKLFVSYALEKKEGNIYDLVIKATNAGEGTAYNVTFGIPSIPGLSEGQVIQVLSSYSDFAGEREGWGNLNLGNIPPGETAAGRFTIMGDGLDNITKLPNIPVEVKRSMDNPNIITVPLTMQPYYSEKFDILRSQFDVLRSEIDELEENHHNIMEKTSSELGDIIVDAFDFARRLMVYASWSAMLDYTKSFIELMNFGSDMLKKRRETISELVAEDKDPSFIEDLLNFGKDYLKDTAIDKIVDIAVKMVDIEKLAELKTGLGKLFTEDDRALISLYISKGWELRGQIKGLEEKLEKLKETLPSVISRSITAARLLEKEENSLLEQLNNDFFIDFDWDTEKEDFLAYREEADYYLEEAGVALRSAELHTGEQKKTWFNMGKDWFTLSKQNQMLAEGALNSLMKETSNERAITLLANLRMVYLERVIFADRPLQLTQEKIAMELELDELKAQLNEIKELLKKMSIPPEVLDIEVPEFGTLHELYNEFSETKLLKAVYDVLPDWAEKLGILAKDARENVSSPEEMGQLLQNFVDYVYALTGGWEIPEEEMNAFIARLYDHDSTMRPKLVLEEAIKYLPFYADISRDSLAGDKDFIPESTERMVLEVRREIEKAAKFNVFDMQEKVTELLDEARAILDIYNDPDEAPAYYPMEALINYLRNLNSKLEYGYKTGIYPNLWLYDGYGENLKAVNYDLGEMYDAQLNFHLTLASAGDLYEEQYEINKYKQIGVFIKLATTALAGVTGSIVGTVFDETVDTVYSDAIGQMESALAQRQEAYNAQVGQLLANNFMEIGKALGREVGVAQTVLNVLEAVDKWRKIDPPLPLTVMSFNIPDVVMEYGDIAESEAILVIRNDHSGTLDVAPYLFIFNSRRQVSKNNGDVISILPG
ncbi:MAG TPA: carboxypeptidase regulatory-like domain-containing protein, partial [Clostridiaceae bacterium]|nr:carboxypeptidase regulatory-like domain-containing protein [Clostridiaceae bacterium]